MFLICLTVLFVACNSFPSSREESPGKKLITLGDGVQFGWTLFGNNLQMQLQLDSFVTWVIVGFHTEPFTKSQDEDMALIFIKHKGRYNENTVVKSVYVTEDNELRSSENNLYEMESSSSSDITLYRRVGTLSTTEPLKLLWAFGGENTIKGVSDSFNNRVRSGYVILSKQNIIIMSLPTEEGATVTTTIIISSPKPVNVETNLGYTNIPVSKPKGESEQFSNYKEIENSPNEKTLEFTATKTNEPAIETGYPIIQTTVLSPTTASDSFKENKMDWHDIEVPVHTVESYVTGTTPCPQPTCNCDSVASHRYDNLNDKVYMAIIGASALFTGLIVLCIACLCATNKSRIPKIRKHRVAFYKVDDFESADEEIEFLKEGDEKNKE